jgi:hypothetical protein
MKMSLAEADIVLIVTDDSVFSYGSGREGQLLYVLRLQEQFPEKQFLLVVVTEDHAQTRGKVFMRAKHLKRCPLSDMWFDVQTTNDGLIIAKAVGLFNLRQQNNMASNAFQERACAEIKLGCCAALHSIGESDFPLAFCAVFAWEIVQQLLGPTAVAEKAVMGIAVTVDSDIVHLTGALLLQENVAGRALRNVGVTLLTPGTSVSADNFADETLDISGAGRCGWTCDMVAAPFVRSDASPGVPDSVATYPKLRNAAEEAYAEFEEKHGRAPTCEELIPIIYAQFNSAEAVEDAGYTLVMILENFRALFELPVLINPRTSRLRRQPGSGDSD